MKISDINTLPPEKIKDEMQRVVGEGKVYFEFCHRRADGTVREVAVFSSPILLKGRRLLHSIIHDITEKKQAERERNKLQERLAHAQRMESLGHLAGGIAHDFNNLLTAIIGFAQLIKLKVSKDDPQQEYAEQILSAGKRGASVTQQILAFSRKQTLDIRPVDLNETLRNLEKLMRRLLREDIEIQFKLSDKKMVVLADPNQIDQIVINLTTNARDAMPSGGRFEIASTFFVVDDEFAKMHGLSIKGQYALITFTDTGCGMDAENISHIFEPFYSTKEVGKGTGLGLSVVYGIVSQHKGCINVYSEKGKGTVFKIYLPLAEDAEIYSKGHKEVLELKGGNETILVAEDDQSLRHLFNTTLTQYGYKVIEAIDGEDAINKFIENKDEIKLVILDGIMPKKNGKEAFDKISEIAPNIRVIFMSGYAEEIFTRSGMLEISAKFLQKPITPELLIKTIRAVLDGDVP